jgi:hypothetical protein
MQTNGHCSICGIEGKRKEDFICENCGDPLRIILTCRCCRERLDITDLDRREYEEFIGRKLEPGMAIAHLCEKCSKEKKQSILIYSVKPITQAAA